MLRQIASVACRALHGPASILAAALLFAPAAWADDIGDPVAGRKVAQAWCSNCHVFPGSTHATVTGAPSFSAIAAHSTTTPLGLRAFLQTPHGRMPDLHLSNSEMDDLIAFILSTKRK
jgi:mono/diheme cytochrome c family protein